MSLRIILIAGGIVALLFGLFFVLGSETIIQGYSLGPSNVAERLFARAIGASLLTLGVIDLLASMDLGSPALRAVVIGNVVTHILDLIVDFSEGAAANPGVWLSAVVHVVFIVAFGYCLINWGKMTKPGMA